MQCPECPRTVEELEQLIIVLTDPIYNKTPESYRQRSEAVKNILSYAVIEDREVGAMLLTCRLDTLPDEFQRDYEKMLQWGKNQRKARKHYQMHFLGEEDGGCEPCNELYEQLCVKYAKDLAKDRRINIAANPEMLEGLVAEADSGYLGILKS